VAEGNDMLMLTVKHGKGPVYTTSTKLNEKVL